MSCSGQGRDLSYVPCEPGQEEARKPHPPSPSPSVSLTKEHFWVEPVKSALPPVGSVDHKRAKEVIFAPAPNDTSLSTHPFIHHSTNTSCVQSSTPHQPPSVSWVVAGLPSGVPAGHTHTSQATLQAVAWHLGFQPGPLLPLEGIEGPAEQPAEELAVMKFSWRHRHRRCALLAPGRGMAGPEPCLLCPSVESPSSHPPQAGAGKPRTLAQCGRGLGLFKDREVPASPCLGWTSETVCLQQQSSEQGQASLVSSLAPSGPTATPSGLSFWASQGPSPTAQKSLGVQSGIPHSVTVLVRSFPGARNPSWKYPRRLHQTQVTQQETCGVQGWQDPSKAPGAAELLKCPRALSP